MKLLKKSLKKFITQESLIAVTKYKENVRLDKRVIGKTETFKNDILKIMVINGIETFDQNKIANGFNNFFYWNWG